MRQGHANREGPLSPLWPCVLRGRDQGTRTLTQLRLEREQVTLSVIFDLRTISEFIAGVQVLSFSIKVHRFVPLTISYHLA